MSTSSLLAAVLLNPRALMAHWRESICATCRLLARRSASARLAASALGHNLQLPSGAARAFLRHRQAVSRHLGAEDLTVLPTGRTLQGWTRKLPRQDSNLPPVDTERARPRARDQKTKRLAAGKSRRKPRNGPESHATDRPHTGTRRKRARRVRYEPPTRQPRSNAGPSAPAVDPGRSCSSPCWSGMGRSTAHFRGHFNTEEEQ